MGATTHVTLGGKTALVTGGANGMGRAYCRKLAGAGATVVVADIDGAAAERVAAELPGSALPLEVDITSEASVTRAVEVALRRGPGPDILVNNAGGAVGARALLVDTDLATWNENLLLNLTGAFLMCRAVIPSMRARGYGKIVNVCSGSVFSGISAALFLPPGRRHNLVPYLAAKGGILARPRAGAGGGGGGAIGVTAAARGYPLPGGPQRTLAAEAPAEVLQ